MAAGVAWVLNLDADLELAAPGTYAPRARVLEVMRPHVERLRASLLGPDDRLVDDRAAGSGAPGLRGRAFCPTPRAIELLRRSGAEPEPHPSLAVLRAVNSRAFATSLGTTLPGAVFVTSADEARSAIKESPPLAERWRIKYAFGMAGRNQRVVPVGEMRRDDDAFLRTGIASGGVQIEPNVRLEDEWAMHGILGEDGALKLGALVKQRCDRQGAWVSTEEVDTRSPETSEVSDRMRREVHLVGAALCRAGYFGPFGVDAYSYRGDDGVRRFQPRSEINARYSMGFAVGFPRPP